MQPDAVFVLSFAILSLITGCTARATVELRGNDVAIKKFNYQGPLPIKDDRTGEVINKEDDEEDTVPMLDTSSQSNQTIDEAACWKLIVEQSGEFNSQKSF